MPNYIFFYFYTAGAEPPLFPYHRGIKYREKGKNKYWITNKLSGGKNDV
jgi:hypothetical protein